MDPIDRQDAIDIVNGIDTWQAGWRDKAIESMRALPPAQPKWETCFECPLSHGCPKINGCTNEQAIEYASGIPADCPLSAQPEWGKPVGIDRPLADSEIIPRLQAIKVQIGGSYAIERTIEVLEQLPSAEPDLSETCTDCKEYDQERHCCPRWNRVIRETLKDLEAAHAWHECFEDDPSSFPDDDRNVLVSFSNFDLPIIGQWRVDEDGSGCWYLGDMDETFIQNDLYVDGWWELPKKPERN